MSNKGNMVNKGDFSIIKHQNNEVLVKSNKNEEV